MNCLFDSRTPRDIVLTTNGDYILDNICVKSVINEELNGDFIYTATYRLDPDYPKELYDMLTELSIIKVNDEMGDEIFRISSVRKYKKYIDIVARQITITDSLNLWLENVRPTNLTGSAAINYIYNNSLGNKEIFVSSNITDMNTAYYEGMKLYQAFFDSDNSFLNRWGGEVIRNKYNLSINNKRGNDNGLEIRSRKNLLGFESKTNIDSLCTVISPKGYDLLKAPLQYSPLVNNYPSPITKEFKYNFVKVKNENNPDEGFDTEKQAVDELIRLAKLEFSKNHIDVVKAEYTINYIDLSKTEEYKDYIGTETANIGDLISVKEENFNIDIVVRVTKRTYDCIAKRRTTTQLSNKDINIKPPTISDIIAEISKITGGSNDLGQYITSMLEVGLKDSYVVLKPNELLIMDSKDINTAINVTRYNKNGLGFSTTGYYGDYTYGFTIDGKLNASLIATGILSTVLIQNADGSLQIDLSGNKGINFNVNNHKALNIDGNNIKFYDWEGTTLTDPVGTIFSSRVEGTTIPGIIMANKLASYMSLAYQTSSGFYRSYIDFDSNRLINKATFNLMEEDEKQSIYNSSGSPITIWEKSDFLTRPNMKYGTSFGINDSYYINSDASGTFTITYKDTNINMFYLKGDAFSFRDSNGGSMFYKSAGSRMIVSDYDFYVDGNLYVTGSYPKTLSNGEQLQEKVKFDLLHELYKKDLEIEELKTRMDSLEEKINLLLKER